MRLFSYRDRPVHLGPYPWEKLSRTERQPDLSLVRPSNTEVNTPDDCPHTIAAAVDDYLFSIDGLRDGPVGQSRAEIPDDPAARSENLKAAGYFLDSAMVGICRLESEHYLPEVTRHPRFDQAAEEGGGGAAALGKSMSLIFQQIGSVLDDSNESMHHHSHAIVYAVEYPRDPDADEPGAKWIQGMQPQRANLRVAETAAVIAQYLRNLGIDARAHTATSSNIDAHKLAVSAGLATVGSNGELSNPFIADRFGLAVVTTDLELQVDLPLDTQGIWGSLRAKGPGWWLGSGMQKNAWNAVPYARRLFKDSLFPMERIKRVDETTSLIDADRIPRVPKRADFFMRVAFGDLGEVPQKESVDGYSVMKNPLGKALAMMLNGYAKLQRAEHSTECAQGYDDPADNADLIKATLHFLGADMVGISEAPDWVWYSHSADGKPLTPAHKFAITILIDQGHETMEGASGDDWMSAAQSVRSYMRASLVGGVVCQHLRKLGFPATNHTAADGDVLQPPLMLLSGLGEISRIGDLILNPYLGPRLKCGVVTTDFNMRVDKPIDFGLQTFCGSCNKCARECPSGAITAGEKTVFNGYEIWKPDAEKCARYRLTNSGGSMCGRCMKTCPWNLEGIFKEQPFRWLAIKAPKLAPWITRLDDRVGNGSINPVKKWWWDLKTEKNGVVVIATDTNRRGINPELEVKAQDQTLACYPADLAPWPYPAPFPVDREAGIKAYQELLSPAQYRQRLQAGETENLAPVYSVPEGKPPVLMAMVSRRKPVSGDGRVVKFELTSMDGSDLPGFEAGAHIDVTPAPQFIRQYSLAGDPADRSKYIIAVLREDGGRGGSLRVHQVLQEGKPVLVSTPRNHFPLIENAERSLLLAGGIGITPLLAMAHSLHAQNMQFVLFYKAKTRSSASFVEELQQAPWADKVQCFFSDENRLDVADVLGDYRPGDHLYTCGPTGFIETVLQVAQDNGWSEDSLHSEYFAVPDTSHYENYPFKLVLQKSGREVLVSDEEKATEALARNGVAIDTKCSDGLCGACATDYIAGDVEHRDYVLSNEQRLHKVILCCSRAAEAEGEIILDL